MPATYTIVFNTNYKPLINSCLHPIKNKNKLIIIYKLWLVRIQPRCSCRRCSYCWCNRQTCGYHAGRLDTIDRASFIGCGKYPIESLIEPHQRMMAPLDSSLRRLRNVIHAPFNCHRLYVVDETASFFKCSMNTCNETSSVSTGAPPS